MSTTFLKKYKVLQKIGEGSFSEVLKCQDRESGVLYAGKRLKKVYQSMSEILESPEVIAMRKISRHPNILYMVESHYDPLPGKVTLIFELMDMSLYDLMKARKGRALTEERVKIYLYQLLKGLEHLHKHGIFHRDIKPENILLKGDVVKLADLGSIRGIYSRPPYTEYISTRWYRSPECLLTTGFYGPKMDVWATGCVFYELLALKPLFPGANEVDQITKIHIILGTPHARLVAKFRRHKSRNCEYFFPTKGGSGVTNLLPQVTEAAKDILKLMLVYDPENRSNVKRVLEHRYFNELRENESPRQLNTVAPSSSLHDPCQWRNPVLLSYITSERRRKTKPSNGRRCSKVQTGCAFKVPRAVVSTPNARPSLSDKPSIARILQSDQSSATIIADAKKLGRAWGAASICHPGKRHGILKPTGRNVKVHTFVGEFSRTFIFSCTLAGEYLDVVHVEESMSDITENSSMGLPSIKRSSKMIIVRENGTDPLERRTTLTKHGPSPLANQCDFKGAKTFDPSYKRKMHCERKSKNAEQEDNRISSFLPQIISDKPGHYRHIPVSSTGSAPNQNYTANNVYSSRRHKARLATINETPSPDLPLCKTIQHVKSPIAKSPAKKIAKHEISSICPSISMITAKKIRPSPRRIYERRDRYRMKQ